MPEATIKRRLWHAFFKSTLSISPFLSPGKAGGYPDLKNKKAPVKNEAFSELIWRPQGFEPCCRREPVSWRARRWGREMKWKNFEIETLKVSKIFLF
jgi:hypothetical protein